SPRTKSTASWLSVTSSVHCASPMPSSAALAATAFPMLSTSTCAIQTDTASKSTPRTTTPATQTTQLLCGTCTITSAATGGAPQLFLPGTPTLPASWTSTATSFPWSSAPMPPSWKRPSAPTVSPTLVQKTSRTCQSGSKASTSWVTSFNRRRSNRRCYLNNS